jgi:hypothetical protein
MASEASARMRSFSVRTTVMWYARSGRLPLCGGSVGQDIATAAVISRSSSSGSARMTSPPGRFSRRARVTSVGRNLSNRENAGSRRRSGGRNGVRTVTCAGMPKRAAWSCSARQRPTSDSASGVTRRSHTSRSLALVRHLSGRTKAPLTRGSRSLDRRLSSAYFTQTAQIVYWRACELPLFRILTAQPLPPPSGRLSTTWAYGS